MMRFGMALISFVILVLFCAPVQGLDFPRGPVILTLSGMISRENAGGKALLDAAALKSLTQVTITTDTPWTDGVVSFEGPLLKDVLELVGAEGNSLKATAINDYFVDIPLSDADEYGVILAMRMNDQELTIRSKGPLWLIYPWKENTSLRSEIYYSRSIWQLMSIDVQ